MKITLLFSALLAAFAATGQSYTVTAGNGTITITESDTTTFTNCDLYRVEYVFYGNCSAVGTGKILPSLNVTFPLPTELAESGFSVRKVRWHGHAKPGGMNWYSYTGNCFVIVPPVTPPTAAPDTVYLQPYSPVIPAGIPQPNWCCAKVDGNGVSFEPTPLMPSGCEVLETIIVSPAGYIAPAENLAPGSYFASILFRWQDMYFLQNIMFHIQ